MLEKEEEKRFGGCESLKNERIAKKKKKKIIVLRGTKKKKCSYFSNQKKKACGMAGSAEFCFVIFYEEALQ